MRKKPAAKRKVRSSSGAEAKGKVKAKGRATETASKRAPRAKTPAEISARTIEQILGRRGALRKVDDDLYVIHQGSTYVTINICETEAGTCLVRVCAQVVANVRPEPSLFRQLMVLNACQRFGAFAYLPEGDLVLFIHSMLGGEHLDPRELLASVTDVALVADAYDDRIVARYGGLRMQDVVEENAIARIVAPGREAELLREWESQKS